MGSGLDRAGAVPGHGPTHDRLADGATLADQGVAVAGPPAWAGAARTVRRHSTVVPVGVT